MFYDLTVFAISRVNVKKCNLPVNLLDLSKGLANWKFVWTNGCIGPTLSIYQPLFWALWYQVDTILTRHPHFLNVFFFKCKIMLLINNLWVRLSILRRIMAPSKMSVILHMIPKPNSIIVLLFIQNNSIILHMIRKLNSTIVLLFIQNNS